MNLEVKTLISSPIPTSNNIDIQKSCSTKRPDSILKTKPNKLICYQILPIVHQIVDENCRQFLNNYEE